MARRVIALRGTPIVNEDDLAIEALIPGHLIMHNGSTGLVKNTSNANNVMPMFALERDEIGKDIDTAYAINDAVKVGVFHTGQHVYAFLASGHNVAKGAYLTGDNAGLLSLTSVSATIRSFRALEAVNTTGSAPVAGTRIRVEVL